MKKQSFWLTFFLGLLSLCICACMLFVTFSVVTNNQVLSKEQARITREVKDVTKQLNDKIETLEKKLVNLEDVVKAPVKPQTQTSMVSTGFSEKPDLVHYVQWGDTLSNISMRYGVSVDFLAQYNNIYDVNIIRCGSALRIPRY